MKVVGKQCAKHPENGGMRYSSNMACTKCQNEATAAYYQRNKEKHKKVVAEYYELVTKKKRRENPDHYAEIGLRFRQRNPEKCREWSKRWRECNREKWLENGKQSWIKRYAVIGTQKISKAFSKQIKEIYRKCPDGHEVDHIVPLRGRGVVGLHVPWNLQYLPARQNKMKGNRLLESM